MIVTKNNFSFFKLIICLLLLTGNCMAQSKKKIKKLKLRQIEIVESVNQSSKPITKSEYNHDGLLVSEENYDQNGQMNEVKKWAYNAKGNPTLERKLNGHNQLLEMKTYQYNALHQKVEEVTFDGNCKMKKKELFVYNAYGLKVEKRIYNEKNQLISLRKFKYTYD